MDFLPLLLLLAPIDHNVVSVENIGNISNSDHCSIMVELSVDYNDEFESGSVQDWRNADKDGMSEYLRSIDWNIELAVEDPWEAFMRKLEVCFDYFVPVKRRKNVRSRPLWLTNEAKRMCATKRRHFKNYLTSKSSQDFAQYKQSEKKCKKMILKAKRNFEKKVANSDDIKIFSKYVKSKTKNKDSVGPLKSGGVLVSEPDKMCQILNEYFSSVFTTDNGVTHDNYGDKNKGTSILVYMSLLKKSLK